MDFKKLVTLLLTLMSQVSYSNSDFYKISQEDLIKLSLIKKYSTDFEGYVTGKIKKGEIVFSPDGKVVINLETISILKELNKIATGDAGAQQSRICQKTSPE